MAKKLVAVFVICVVVFAAFNVQEAEAATKDEKFKQCYNKCFNKCKGEGNGYSDCETKCVDNCTAQETADELNINLK